jgi:hypothetical protein
MYRLKIHPQTLNRTDAAISATSSHSVTSELDVQARLGINSEWLRFGINSEILRLGINSEWLR